jgi:hypothetical protein
MTTDILSSALSVLRGIHKQPKEVEVAHELHESCGGGQLPEIAPGVVELCAGCSCREVISIAGLDVAGCVRPMGDGGEEWRRIPAPDQQEYFCPYL